MQARDQLYGEAEAAYRRFFAEDERIYRAGGIDQPTQVLQETTTGQFLEDSMRIYRGLKKYKAKMVGGPFKLAWLKREPTASYAGSAAAMTACVDLTAATMVTKGEPNQNGGYTKDTIFFNRVDGVLKLQNANGDVAKSC